MSHFANSSDVALLSEMYGSATAGVSLPPVDPETEWRWFPPGTATIADGVAVALLVALDEGD